jgi:hypothetical protein
MTEIILIEIESSGHVFMPLRALAAVIGITSGVHLYARDLRGLQPSLEKGGHDQGALGSGCGGAR